MTRLILLLAFLFFPITGCYSQNQKNITVKVELPDPYTWDFGQVKEGESLEHAFILKNESENTLVIKKLQTSCGCTASEAGKTELLPGESTEIKVKFNSKGYSGPISQYLYVHTDSLDNPIIKYTIKADVVKQSNAN